MPLYECVFIARNDITQQQVDTIADQISAVIAEQGGSRWVVPKTFHSPIDQQAILLKTGENNAAAKAFLAFLKTPKAAAIIKRYGYEVRP